MENCQVWKAFPDDFVEMKKLMLHNLSVYGIAAHYIEWTNPIPDCLDDESIKIQLADLYRQCNNKQR
jgi:hypothetical protein